MNIKNFFAGSTALIAISTNAQAINQKYVEKPLETATFENYDSFQKSSQTIPAKKIRLVFNIFQQRDEWMKFCNDPSINRFEEVSFLVLGNFLYVTKEDWIECFNRLNEIKGLDLSQNSTKPSGMKDLVKYLPQSLKVLNLSRNNMDDAVLKILAKHIPKQLEKILLNDNFITDEGLKILLPRLPKTITRLSLSGNPISDKSADLLIKWMPSTLTFLSLNGTQISPKAMQRLEAKVEKIIMQTK